MLCNVPVAMPTKWKWGAEENWQLVAFGLGVDSLQGCGHSTEGESDEKEEKNWFNADQRSMMYVAGLVNKKA